MLHDRSAAPTRSHFIGRSPAAFGILVVSALCSIGAEDARAGCYLFGNKDDCLNDMKSSVNDLCMQDGLQGVKRCADPGFAATFQGLRAARMAKLINSVNECGALVKTAVELGGKAVQAYAAYQGVPIPPQVMEIGKRQYREHGIFSCEAIWKEKFNSASLLLDTSNNTYVANPSVGGAGAFVPGAAAPQMSEAEIALEREKMELQSQTEQAHIANEQLKIQNDFALGQKKYQLEKAKAEADAALRAQELSIEAQYKQGLISNEARRIELQNARETYRLKTERIRAIEMGLIGQIQAGNQAAAIANDAAGMNLIDHQIDSFSDTDTNRLYEMQLNR